MKQFQYAVDRFSIGLSCLCAIHCLALPVLMVAFPVLSSMAFADESFHQLLLVAVIPSSVLALFFGYRHHGKGAIVGLGAVGLIVLVLGAVLGHDLFGEMGEKVMTLIGASLIAFSHIRNFMLSKRCCSSC